MANLINRKFDTTVDSVNNIRGTNIFFTNPNAKLGADAWREYPSIMIMTDEARKNKGLRPSIDFLIENQITGALYMDMDGTLKYYTWTGHYQLNMTKISNATNATIKE